MRFGPRSLALCLIAVIGCQQSSSPRGADVRDPPQVGPPSNALLTGTLSCSGRGCHADFERPTVKDQAPSRYSYTRWLHQDPHTRAYRVLFEPLAVEMGKKLDIKNVAEEPRCLVCHCTPQASRDEPGGARGTHLRSRLRGMPRTGSRLVGSSPGCRLEEDDEGRKTRGVPNGQDELAAESRRPRRGLRRLSRRCSGGAGTRSAGSRHEPRLHRGRPSAFTVRVRILPRQRTEALGGENGLGNKSEPLARRARRGRLRGTRLAGRPGSIGSFRPPAARRPRHRLRR